MGQFLPGEINNPNGRPKNSGHRQQLFNSLVAPRREELVNKAIEMALSGNEVMLKILLERSLPAKPTDDAINFDLPISEVSSAETLAQIGATTLKSLADGNITPSEAQKIAGVIMANIKAIEVNELNLRLTNLEKKEIIKS